MPPHLDTGKTGEDLAAAFLESKGLLILHRNWRFRRAEVDIVAMDGEVLVLAEVKTRRTDRFGRPEEFVSAKKQRFLAEAASCYMEEFDYNWELRFDVVAIILRSETDYDIEHFPDAFFPEWG